VDASWDGISVATIGHSNHAFDRLVALLAEHRIATVVDVRSSPYSRFLPQFNREDLAVGLARSGLVYAFAGEYLGGRPKDPACYKAGVVPDGKADYLSLVDYDAVAQQPWFLRGVARLRDLAAERPTTLLCAEEDPARCHRHHLIARDLVRRGATVVHIRGTGTTERMTAELFERDAVAARQLALLP